VLPAGGNDVFVVQDGKKELLVPALVAVVKKIDLEAHRIDISLPPVLRDIYEV